MHDAQNKPLLWHVPAPVHFDSRWPTPLKVGLMLLLIGSVYMFVDAPLTRWLLENKISEKLLRGDIRRESIWLEQYGQYVCTISVILAVALCDKEGRRKSLAIVIVCLLTVLVSYALKDLCGRSRPMMFDDLHLQPGQWVWGGIIQGITGGSGYASFPSSHTTGAFALSAALAWYYPRARGIFYALATIVAGLRVLNTAHWLSDVLAGALIAVTVARLALNAKLPGRMINALPSRIRAFYLSDWPDHPRHDAK